MVINSFVDNLNIPIGINEIPESHLRPLTKIPEDERQTKQQLPHGEFGDWLKVNCRVKEDMARRYMKLANEKPEYLKHDCNRVLSIQAAYALLSAHPQFWTKDHDKIPIRLPKL